ncbi:TonB-dependent receptor [Candidatus Albibeggiatoa sp. nov. NOAA]|uniref:TonB-dependent receptor plug domain-containing protein n=1 Tax=Candidatus Albibeggiatoa sp. nov. NOAA TaxID=3162724 RepID=UPI0032F6094C|nr:TonB-dependent receptor [Thiotrichaceae bacterium]
MFIFDYFREIKYFLIFILFFNAILFIQAANSASNDQTNLAELALLSELTRLTELSLEELMQVSVVTIATGAKQFANKAPSATTVITAQDIEYMGARSLDEILRTVPGLTVSYNYVNQGVYTIRGISSLNTPEVLILLNGIRVNASYTGGKGLYWGGFPTSMIARVEVIRGPGSAVYGADAFAGVINIITKTAEEIDGTEVGVRIGNFNTQDTWVQHGSQINGWNFAAMVEYSNTDGHQRTVEADAQTILDQTFGTDASLAPGPYGSELTYYNARFDLSKAHWRLRAGIHHTEDMGIGIGVGQALDPTKPSSEKRINVDLTYHNPDFTENWEVEAQVNYHHTGYAAALNLYPAGTFGGAYPIGFIAEPTALEKNTQLMLSGFYHGLDQHLIRIGAGVGNYDMYKTSYVRNDGINPFTGETMNPLQRVDVTGTIAEAVSEATRRNWFAFLQDTWTIHDDWELTAGIRYDDYSDFGSTVNPRLGLIWQTSEKLITKFLYGQAFRAPGFTEQRIQSNPIAKGNPNIKPEEIETFEIGFDFRATDDLNLALNLFRYEASDKVGLQRQGDGTAFLYTNLSDWRGQGFEFETRWRINEKLSVLFNYNYQDSEDKATGANLNTAPKQTLFWQGDYLMSPYWLLNAQVHWTSDWFRAQNDPREPLSGYTTVDLVLRGQEIFNSRTDMTIGVRNIFNDDVRYPSPNSASGIVNVPNDLPSGGRFYFVEFQYHF